MRIVTVVEKESDREALEKMIRKIGPGYETAGAASGGQEGYALIKEENPDLIIAETGLTRMDGLLMLKKLRREKMRTKVILLADREDFRQMKQAFDLGVAGYFVKPVKTAELKKRSL